jgi:hypothetical protein
MPQWLADAERVLKYRLCGIAVVGQVGTFRRHSQGLLLRTSIDYGLSEERIGRYISHRRPSIGPTLVKIRRAAPQKASARR